MNVFERLVRWSGSTRFANQRSLPSGVRELYINTDMDLGAL